MTGPAVQGLDPRIVKNLQIMQQRGMTGDIPTYLRDIEGVDPSLYTRGPDLKQQFTHGAGLIARMGLQGVGNLASLPFGMAGAAYQGVTGRQPPAMLQGNQGTAAANQLGLPQPQGAGERIASAAGENAVMGGILPGGTAGMAALGAGAGAAGQGAAEMGASPMGQMAASAAVGMGIPVVSALGGAAIRRMVAGAAERRAAAEQSLALLQAGGQDTGASLGQVTEGGVAKRLQGALRNVPGASGVFQEAGAKQAASMQGRVEGVADRIGPGGTPTTAGLAVQKGIDEGYIPRFKATANQLYDKVFSLVPPETPIIPSASVKLAAEQHYLSSSAPPLSDHIAAPKVAGILNDLATTVESNPAGVPFGVLKEIRSRLGAMLNGDELVADVNLRDVKRLYGALSEDMKTGIARHGDDALASWTRAENFWQQGTERIQGILQPLMDKNVPQKAFTALMSGTKEGAGVLGSTMKSLRPAERNLVSSTVLRNLGHNPGTDSFSPELYLTNWNKLAPESKSALFDNAGTGIHQDLDKLAQALTLRRTAHNLMPNPSGTAPNTAFFSILAGLGAVGTNALTGTASGAGLGAMLGPAVGAGGANLAARAFTSPRIVSWMVRQTKIPFGAIGQELLILAKDAQKWPPEERETALGLTQALGKVDWNLVLLAHAAADATAGRQQ